MFLHPLCQAAEHEVASPQCPQPEFPAQRGPRGSCPSMKACCFEEVSVENQTHRGTSWDEELENVVAGKVWNILKLSIQKQLGICTQERGKKIVGKDGRGGMETEGMEKRTAHQNLCLGEVEEHGYIKA